jgi:ribosome-interacting GTPase 1
VYVAMPMPHRTQQQLIKRRLVGKDGAERIRELRAILAELPGYRNGPYADLRKWVEGELAASCARKRVVHRDSIAVRREGAGQIALVGPPNVGNDDAADGGDDGPGRRARPARGDPGLIEGAADDRGGGRALLGVLRNADAIRWCHACGRPLAGLEAIRDEVAAAGIELPARARGRHQVRRGAAADASRAARPARVHPRRREPDRLREQQWALTGLVRVHLRDGGDPVALRPPATVLDVADTIHHELRERCAGARVRGPSARFPGQQVGRGLRAERRRHHRGPRQLGRFGFSGASEDRRR